MRARSIAYIFKQEETAMKKPVQLIEDENEGLILLLNEKVTIMCMNFFYTGELVGVNDTCVKLKDPSIVYSTGDWLEKEYSDVQKLPTDTLYVQTSSIEAFGTLK